MLRVFEDIWKDFNPFLVSVGLGEPDPDTDDQDEEDNYDVPNDPVED